MESARSMLTHAKLPDNLWAEAVEEPQPKSLDSVWLYCVYAHIPDS